MKSQVSTILSRADIEKLKKGFDRKELEDLFVDVLGGSYDRTKSYVKEVHHLFHVRNPSDTRTNRSRLSEEDRERCTIAILASRGEMRNLGVHIYIALMLKISPEEIADTIFLAGIYSGVPSVTDGLGVEIKVLTALKALLNPEGPEGGTPTKGKPSGKGPTQRPREVEPPRIKAVFGALNKVLPV